MLEPAVVVLRLLQYAGAAILMGSSLFFLYALPAAPPWAKGRLAAAAAALAAAATLGLGAQTSLMAGSLAEGLKPDALLAVATGTGLGLAALVRIAAAALAAIVLLVARPGCAAWIVAGLLGAVCAGSFAWMGHGAATEGALHWPHLVADILHAWTASIWIGALAMFLALLVRRDPPPEATAALHRALSGFSGVGTALVAVLVLTGLVNSAVLIGWERIGALWTTPYGGLLSLKLVLFAAMLALAAANRFRLTPALQAGLAAPDAALGALRRSLVVETGLGLAVLALVAGFGTLPPPAAG